MAWILIIDLMRHAYEGSWYSKRMDKEHFTRFCADPKNWQPYFAWLPVWTGQRLLWLTSCYRLTYHHFIIKPPKPGYHTPVRLATKRQYVYSSLNELLIRRLKYVGD